MQVLLLCVALCVLGVLCAAEPGQAMISPTSGAYDGRGKTPEQFKVLPGKPKRQPRYDTSAQNGK